MWATSTALKRDATDTARPTTRCWHGDPSRKEGRKRMKEIGKVKVRCDIGYKADASTIVPNYWINSD